MAKSYSFVQFLLIKFVELQYLLNKNARFDINFQLLEACEIGLLSINMPLFGKSKGYSIFFIMWVCSLSSDNDLTIYKDI